MLDTIKTGKFLDKYFQYRCPPHLKTNSTRLALLHLAAPDYHISEDDFLYILAPNRDRLNGNAYLAVHRIFGSTPRDLFSKIGSFKDIVREVCEEDHIYPNSREYEIVCELARQALLSRLFRSATELVYIVFTELSR